MKNDLPLFLSCSLSGILRPFAASQRFSFALFKTNPIYCLSLWLPCTVPRPQAFKPTGDVHRIQSQNDCQFAVHERPLRYPGCNNVGLAFCVVVFCTV